MSLSGRAKQGLTLSLMAFPCRCLSSKRACSIPITSCVIHARGQQHCNFGNFTSHQPGALPGDRGTEWERAGCCPQAEVTEQQPGRGVGGVLLHSTAGVMKTPVLPLLWQNGETWKFAPTMVIQPASLCHLC